MPLSLKRRVTFLAKTEYFTGTGLKGSRSGCSSPAAARSPSTGPAARPPRTRSTPACGSWARASAGHLPRGHALARRPAVPWQDRRRPIALETGAPVIPVAMLYTGKIAADRRARSSG